MKPLARSQRILRWFSVYPINKKPSELQRILTIFSTMLIWFGNLCPLTASAFFFLKYFSTDFELSLYALFQVVALCGSTNALFVIFIQQRKIIKSFENLAEIYDKSKNKIFSFF